MMDMKEIESTLRSITERLTVANTIAAELEDFSAEELMEDFDREGLVKLAEANDISLESEDNMATNQMKEFLLNDKDQEDFKEFLDLDRPDSDEIKEFHGVK